MHFSTLVCYFNEMYSTFRLQLVEPAASLAFTYITWRAAHYPASWEQFATSFSNPFVTSPSSQLILQPFCCFTYIQAHSTTLPLLHLHHSSFSTLASPTSPGELPMTVPHEDNLVAAWYENWNPVKKIKIKFEYGCHTSGFSRTCPLFQD